MVTTILDPASISPTVGRGREGMLSLFLSLSPNLLALSLFLPGLVLSWLGKWAADSRDVQASTRQKQRDHACKVGCRGQRLFCWCCLCL